MREVERKWKMKDILGERIILVPEYIFRGQSPVVLFSNKDHFPIWILRIVRNLKSNQNMINHTG